MTTPLNLLRAWVMRQAAPDAGAWFAAQIDAIGAAMAEDRLRERDFHITLGMIPRKLGKADLTLSDEDRAAAEEARPGWRPDGWSLDGAGRTAALLATAPDKRPFADRFKDLRATADLGELITLYRGLPLYPEPESFHFEVGEGLRTNIKAVFEAIAHNNPFPRDHFDEHRWNHMVLKAIFVGSSLHHIIGLDERVNSELARILREFAHERWAAGRPVLAETWRCVGPFAAEEGAMADLERAFATDALNRRIVALSLKDVDHGPARALVAGAPEAEAAASGALTWETIAAELEAARAARPAAPVLPNAEIV